MDSISIICNLWSTCSFSPTVLHVYRHQSNYSTDQLPVESQLNCKTDTHAKSIATIAIISDNTTPPSFISLLGLGTVICHNTPINNYLQQEIYHLDTHSNYIYYVSPLFEITSANSTTLVDWD